MFSDLIDMLCESLKCQFRQTVRPSRDFNNRANCSESYRSRLVWSSINLRRKQRKVLIKSRTRLHPNTIRGISLWDATNHDVAINTADPVP